MLEYIQTALRGTSPIASVIISVALMFFTGFAATRITKHLHLPNVTAYILAGVLLGSFCLNLVPQTVVDGMDFLSDIALAFIAFSSGEYFRLDVLRHNSGKVFVITVFETMFAAITVFFSSFCILHLDFSFSIVLAALATATSSASTMMTIRQTGAKGDFVNTLLQVVVIDDIIALLAYSIAISLAQSAASSTSVNVMSIIVPLLSNLAVLALGGLFGFILKLLISKRSTDNRLIILISLLFTFCGICAALEISPLLGCMSMGTVYRNIADDDKLFKQLNYFSPPILLLFFVRSGLNFRIDALFSTSGSIGATPLIVVGVIYFIVRIVGKYAGAFLGCAVCKKDRKVRDYLGLALIPQAGVTIGLAALGARTLGGTVGGSLETIILASSVLYEMAGPALASLSLYLSGSYSDKIEDIAPVEETDAEGKKKNDVELLIERINKIRSELPEQTMSEEEQAFDAAAMEQLEAYRTVNRRRFGAR